MLYRTLKTEGKQEFKLFNIFKEQKVLLKRRETQIWYINIDDEILQEFGYSGFL